MEPKTPTQEEIVSWLTPPPERRPVEPGDVLGAVCELVEERIATARKLDGFDPAKLSKTAAAKYKRLWPRLARIAADAERMAGGATGKVALYDGLMLGVQVQGIVGGFLEAWAERSRQGQGANLKRIPGKRRVMNAIRELLRRTPREQWPKGALRFKEWLEDAGFAVLPSPSPEPDYPSHRRGQTAQFTIYATERNAGDKQGLNLREGDIWVLKRSDTKSLDSRISTFLSESRSILSGGRGHIPR